MQIQCFLGLFPKMESRLFNRCEENRNNELTLPFGRLRYIALANQKCSWKFVLPDDDRNYVFAMQIPYFSVGNENNIVTLPDNSKITNTFMTRLLFLSQSFIKEWPRYYHVLNSAMRY